MTYAQPDKKFLKQAFDSISPVYDRLNQVLSFGNAERWRKKAAKILLKESGFSPETILDLGCGSGKFIECFLKEKAWSHAVGVDFSSQMLKKARENINGNVLWLEGDFDNLPFLDSSFDLVISAFTLRSVQNMPVFLERIHRLLKSGGRLGLLELTRPKNILSRILFFPYLRILLPFIGRLISGNGEAYRFLSSSVQNFQTPEEFAQAMRQVGFQSVAMKSFSFGAATLIIGIP